MLNNLIYQYYSFDLKKVLIGAFVSVFMGFLVAVVHGYTGKSSKAFLVSLVLLPLIVQMVIMMVNGNIGTGVAVMGAFSLIRFRSIPGTSKEIVSVFLAMAVGIATGMGFWLFAIIFGVIALFVMLVFYKIRFGENTEEIHKLKILIPEDLDHKQAFDEILANYTESANLIKIKTTNLGSLFELNYEIRFKKNAEQKAFIDELRCRNGNLTISCSNTKTDKEEL